MLNLDQKLDEIKSFAIGTCGTDPDSWSVVPLPRLHATVLNPGHQPVIFIHLLVCILLFFVTIRYPSCCSNHELGTPACLGDRGA
jgi:hypothetical protein